MTIPTIEQLDNLNLDVIHISDVATSLNETSTDRLGHVKLTVTGAINEIKTFPPRGPRVSGTTYNKKDVYTEGGVAYLTVVNSFVSGTLATDLSNGYVVIYQGLTSNQLAASNGASLVGRGAGTVESAITALEASGGSIAARTTALETIVKGSGAAPSRPAFIEQHITGFFGRGMLTAETNNVATEQAFSANGAVGATTVSVASASSFQVGGCCMIKHDNGKYFSYFISSIGSGTLGIYPKLRHVCTVANARIERLWYNRAHPGKFYMRYLAQRVASAIEFADSMPNGNRILFTNVATNSPRTIEDTLAAMGTATVSYFAADNIGESGITSPVRFITGMSAFVDSITSNNQGAETGLFDTCGVQTAVVKVVFLGRAGGTTFSIRVLDELNVDRGRLILPSNEDTRVARIFTLQVNLRGAKKIKVQVASESFVNSGYFVIDQIDVYESPEFSGKVISKKAATIAWLGDSWPAGDLGNTPEREPITTQLALELPNATIINAGVGGNKINDMLARFDTDVAQYNPDYVVVNTGTNESYSPLSSTFDPTAIQDFLNVYGKVLNRIAEIGARPIIVGCPALAQSDPDVPAFPEWQLNDRAKAYARYFFEWQSTKPFIRSGSNANGDWVKNLDGTMVCNKSVSVTTTAANTLTGVAWTFPIPFVAAAKVDATISNYGVNQLLSSGSSGATTTTASIYAVSGSSGTTITMNCTARGRWTA